jgi:hypothetical protein
MPIKFWPVIPVICGYRFCDDEHDSLTGGGRRRHSGSFCTFSATLANVKNMPFSNTGFFVSSKG